MAKPWRRRLGLLAVMSYLSGLFEAAFLLIVTGAALALNSNSDTIELWGRSLELSTTLWIGAAVLIGRAAASIASSWLGAHVKAAVVASTRSKLMRSFVTTSYDVQSNEHPGTLHELMTTFSNQASLMISALVRIITASANLTALIGLAALVDPLGAIGLVVVIGFLALTLRPLRAVLERRSKQSADAGIMFANSVNETAHLGMELHVFDVGDEAADRVDREIAMVEERSRRVYFTTGLLLPAYTGLAFIAVLVALAIASRGSEIDLGSIGAVVLLMLRSLTYGQSLQTSAATMATAAPWIDKTEERLERYATAHVEERGISLHSFDSVVAEKLSFRYSPSGPNVLEDLNFTIGPKEIVGVVGPSGAGKSTLVQLLLGLREPSAGHLWIDGRSSTEFSRNDWARRATMVPQAPTLIAGTVAENITFLRPGIDREMIERAARLARLHDDISGFPDGYDHQVGTSGSRLSGGQRQRLCIARALVEQPDLLILDEPTSSLDMQSEHLIRESLQRLAQHMTIVIIAHRPSTLSICDRIMVLESGRVADFDSPDAVHERNDFFRTARHLAGMSAKGE